jgi:protein TonB
MNPIRAGLANALLLSLLVHGMLLTGVRPGSALDFERTSRSMQVRMVSVPDTKTTLPAPSFPPPAVPLHPTRPLPEAASRRDSTESGPRPALPKPELAARAAEPPVPRAAEVPVVPAPPASDFPSIPHVRAADYQFGPRLDPGPRPLGDIEPVFPREAGLQEGAVVLRLFIDEEGHVDDLVVVSSSPRGLFEKPALAAFGVAKFAPGMVLGVPVKSQVTVEVNFTPYNRGAGVSGRTY